MNTLLPRDKVLVDTGSVFAEVADEARAIDAVAAATASPGGPPSVRVDGKLREIMHAGRTEATVQLPDLLPDPTLYGVGALAGLRGEITIVDGLTGGWGHILADHFVLSDETVDALLTGQGNAIVTDSNRVTLLQDFEGETYGSWKPDPPLKPSCGEGWGPGAGLSAKRSRRPTSRGTPRSS